MARRLAAGGVVDRVLDAIPPASGAVVMGTGIVSVALSLDGHETTSRALLALDAAIWAMLVVLLPARAASDRARFARDVRTPAALTAVAGTAVLGTRLTLLGWRWAGAALLVVALILWLGLVPNVLGAWKTPTVGVSFVLTVGTESLALLSAALAPAEHAAWLLYAAFAPFALGIVFYVFVLSRFDLRQLAVGHGDHWVVGGALAITTVAAGRIAAAAEDLGALRGAHDALEALSLAVWAVTALWLPVLVVAEARHPRWGYDVRRWSTVFPVGMYAACSFVVGAVSGADPLTDFARGWVWVAVLVWVVVFAAMLKRAALVVRGPGAPAPASRTSVRA